MDFKDGFEWIIVGFFALCTSSVIVPILKLIGVIKLSWWTCLIPSIIALVLIITTYLLFWGVTLGIEKEFRFDRL